MKCHRIRQLKSPSSLQQPSLAIIVSDHQKQLARPASTGIRPPSPSSKLVGNASSLLSTGSASPMIFHTTKHHPTSIPFTSPPLGCAPASSVADKLVGDVAPLPVAIRCRRHMDSENQQQIKLSSGPIQQQDSSCNIDLGDRYRASKLGR